MSKRFCFQASLDNERYVILQDLSFSTYKDFIKVLMDNNPLIVNSFIDQVIADCVVDSNFDIHVPDKRWENLNSNILYHYNSCRQNDKI